MFRSGELSFSKISQFSILFDVESEIVHVYHGWRYVNINDRWIDKEIVTDIRLDEFDLQIGIDIQDCFGYENIYFYQHL